MNNLLPFYLTAFTGKMLSLLLLKGCIWLLICFAAWGLVPGPIFLSESLIKHYQETEPQPLPLPATRGKSSCLEWMQQTICPGDDWENTQIQKQNLPVVEQNSLILFPEQSNLLKTTHVKAILALAPLALSLKHDKQSIPLELKTFPPLAEIAKHYQSPSQTRTLRDFLEEQLPEALGDISVLYFEAQGLAYLWAQDSEDQPRILGVLLM